MSATASRTPRRAAAAFLATAAIGGAALALPSTSGAYCVDDNGDRCPDVTVKARGVVSVNPSTTLGVRHVPKQNARQFRQLKNGARVGIICQTTGSKVTGTFGTSRIWNKLSGGGYASDAYIRTGSDKRVAPNC